MQDQTEASVFQPKGKLKMKLVFLLLLALVAVNCSFAKKGNSCKSMSMPELCAKIEELKERKEELQTRPPPAPTNAFSNIEAESVILRGLPDYFEQLVEYLEPLKQNGLFWKLCYRGSDEGFSNVAFHSRCGTKEATLILIRSQSGSIFGGAVSNSWLDLSHPFPEHAFIYSLKNKVGEPFKCDVQPGKPTMQGGIDLANIQFGVDGPKDLDVKDRCDKTDSYSGYLGSSYTLPPGYTFQSQAAQELLSGGFSFLCSEVEAFYLG